MRRANMTLLLFLWLLAPVTAHGANAALATLADNTAMDLGPMACSTVSGEPTDYCQFVTDYSGMIYAKALQRILMFGGGHSTTYSDALYVFDPNTLIWTEQYRPTPCSAMTASNFDSTNTAWKSGPSGPYPRPTSRHTYDLTAFAEVNSQFVLMMNSNGGGQYCPPPGGSTPAFSPPYSKIAHFNFSNSTWAFATHSSAWNDGYPIQEAYNASEYDPVSQKIIIMGRYGLWVYDPVTKVKTKHMDFVDEPAFGYTSHMVYFPPNQKMYYFNRMDRKVVEVTLNRNNWASSTYTVLSTTGTPCPAEEPGYDYDSANRVIGGCVWNNKFYAFDPTTRAWSSPTILGGSPGNLAFHAISYDPVNNVFIFLTEARHTWAYRYKRGGDTKRPSGPPAPPSLD